MGALILLHMIPVIALPGGRMNPKRNAPAAAVCATARARRNPRHETRCERQIAAGIVNALMTRELVVIMANPEAQGCRYFERYLAEVFNTLMVAARLDGTAALKNRGDEFAATDPHLSSTGARRMFLDISLDTLPGTAPPKRSSFASDSARRTRLCGRAHSNPSYSVFPACLVFAFGGF